MVEIEQYGQQNCERYGEENLANANLPEVDEPTAVLSRKEGLAGWQSVQLNTPHPANVYKAGEEDDGQRGAIVFNELSNITLEQ